MDRRGLRPRYTFVHVRFRIYHVFYFLNFYDLLLSFFSRPLRYGVGGGPNPWGKPHAVSLDSVYEEEGWSVCKLYIFDGRPD